MDLKGLLPSGIGGSHLQLTVVIVGLSVQLEQATNAFKDGSSSILHDDGLAWLRFLHI